jgi:phosphatidylinositol alpha-1,6-mannosyltransferase
MFRAANPAFADTDITICHPGLPDVEKQRDAPEENFALIVGRMSSAERYKGHDALIDIWGDMTKVEPGARLVIAGSGDDRPRLETKVRHLGLGNVVEFVGHVSDADLMQLYRTCAFFVMPSSNEGFGFVFLEAMRAGKACIGGLGAATELIEDGTTGFVVNPGDPGAVKAAVQKLWGRPELRKTMGSLGRARFLAQFTRERFEQRFGALLPSSTFGSTTGGAEK